MDIQTILKDYWGQVSFVLLGAGYLIQKLLENRQRRFEVRYTLFSEAKINAVDTFFRAYVKTFDMWQTLDYKAVISGTKSDQELDNIVLPPMYELRAATISLRTFFDEGHQMYFATVVNVMLDLFEKIKELPKTKDPVKLSETWLNFYEYKTKKMEEADVQLQVFSAFFKNHFLDKKK